MDIKVEIKNIEPGQVSTVLREVKAELFAPVAPSAVGQLLQAYLQSQAVQAAEPTAMRSAVDGAALPPTPSSRQFQPAQVFGAAGMRRIPPATATDIPATALATVAQAETQDDRQETVPTVVTTKDLFSNNWIFGLMIAAILLGGLCGFTKQNPLSLLKFSAPSPSPSVPVKPPSAPPKPQ